MKDFWIAIFLASALLTSTAASPAYGQEPLSNRPDDTSPIKDGMSLVAEITKGLNSRKAKLGDEVKARLTQDVIAKGLIVMPRESQLVGHVTETKARSKEDPEARLGIVFDRALLKNGKQIEMSAVVQALAPPFARATFIDQSDPMITQANERTSKMVPRLDSGNNRNMNDTSARSAAPKVRLANDGNIQSGSSTPWAPGSRLGSGNRGVFGLPDLALTSSKQPAITSIKNDVKLESGTQVVLKVISVDR